VVRREQGCADLICKEGCVAVVGVVLFEVNTAQGKRSRCMHSSLTPVLHVEASGAGALAVYMQKCRVYAELQLHQVQGYCSNGA
jgi:hypothetical protein